MSTPRYQFESDDIRGRSQVAGSSWGPSKCEAIPAGLTDLTKAIYTSAEEQKINDPRLGAVGYAFTRCLDAAELSMAAMTSWRRTASAKSGTV